MKAVIMAGGTGTRFWPKSIEEKPKQFLNLTSDKTMIQETYLRFREWLPKDDVYIVTTRRYLSLVREQLPEIADTQIIVEPDQRDTGPCVALTALHFLQQGVDDVLVITPSDQYIPDVEQLKESLLLAEEVAKCNRTIVTLGVVPTRPETGYGYIETSMEPSSSRVYPVKQFIEKPTLERAEQLIKLDHMYWNSGIFVWKPSTISHYMKQQQPETWRLMTEAGSDLEAVYSQLPKISVDYAILEKADHISMIPVQFDWDDVGTWSSLERMHAANEDGNVINGPVKAMSTQNSIILTEEHQTIVIGVEDLIVVSTKNGLLVCPKSKEQNIKKALQSLMESKGGKHIR